MERIHSRLVVDRNSDERTISSVARRQHRTQTEERMGQTSSDGVSSWGVSRPVREGVVYLFDILIPLPKDNTRESQSPFARY